MEQKTQTEQIVQSAQQDIKSVEVKYDVAGNEVKLSYNIVKKFLTRGKGGEVSDPDIVQFINICRFNKLNPFLNEAYLVTYNGKDGTTNAQMIVSKEALLKRADACPEYDGIESGIIVKRDGNIVELDGCFHLDGDELLGGWARVFRKDRKFPIIAKVRVSEYNTNQSLWVSKKATMIAKVAKVQALREAFPAQLGAMYTDDETNAPQDAEYEEIKNDVEKEKQENANKQAVEMPQPEQQVEKPVAANTPKNEPGF